LKKPITKKTAPGINNNVIAIKSRNTIMNLPNPASEKDEKVTNIKIIITRNVMKYIFSPILTHLLFTFIKTIKTIKIDPKIKTITKIVNKIDEKFALAPVVHYIPIHIRM
jgi:hypothetical protein